MERDLVAEPGLDLRAGTRHVIRYGLLQVGHKVSITIHGTRQHLGERFSPLAFFGCRVPENQASGLAGPAHY
jgi:hypothetical protein